MWTDIACIVFVCVTANHLGLVGAVEEAFGRKLPIVNCCKCLTFWVTVVYCFGQTEAHTTAVLAISFLASYAALWLELAEGYIDTLYVRCYETIYPRTENDADSATGGEGDTDSAVSDLRESAEQ